MQKKYDENNIFQKIIKKEIPSTIVYEDDKILAFNRLISSSSLAIPAT